VIGRAASELHGHHRAVHSRAARVALVLLLAGCRAASHADPKRASGISTPASAWAATAPPKDLTPPTSAPTTTRRPIRAVVVTGRAGGAPPCATGPQGAYGADVSHPERAPLQAQAEFARGVRWAVCGASDDAGYELFNLRSNNRGRTWRVTDTGTGILLFHAGDRLHVRLLNARVGRMELISLVADFDIRCDTADGGAGWHCVHRHDRL
jgi:hypothetical protein